MESRPMHDVIGTRGIRMKLVMKFGGTSISNGEKIGRVSQIIQRHASEGDELVVVVSALDGVTEQLIEATEKARRDGLRYIEGFISQFLDRHTTVAEESIGDGDILRMVLTAIKDIIGELDRILIGVSYLGEATPRSMDAILSFGERLSTIIVRGALEALGLRTVCLTGRDVGITTDSKFGEARPLMELTTSQIRRNLGSRLEDGVIPVVTGYIAADREGHVTTLGRGGSDYTATIIGSALGADEVWIWTDVDGLMTADPRIVPSARVIREISFPEATEMALFGVRRMHPRAFQPAMNRGLPVRIRNTFDPSNPGTLIVVGPEERAPQVVKAVILVEDVSVVTVSGMDMIGAPGTAARIFNVLGRSGVNIMMISQSVSEAGISLVISNKGLHLALEALEESPFNGEQEVTYEDDVCVIAVIGAGMKGTPGVFARILKAVAQKGINVSMIAQGSSELNLSFVVKRRDGREAVRAIHEEYRLGDSQGDSKPRRS
jgi:aspartate kinase